MKWELGSTRLRQHLHLLNREMVSTRLQRYKEAEQRRLIRSPLVFLDEEPYW